MGRNCMNNKHIKYIFTDLDGTLGRGELGIPDKNRKMIKEFVTRGGKFGICTGRAPGSASGFMQDIPINTISVVNGGCALYNFQTGQLQDELFVPEGAFQYAIEAQKKIEKYIKCNLIVVNRDGYWPCTAENADRILRPWYRIIFQVSPEYAMDIAKEVQEQKPDNVRIESSAPDFVEIMHISAGKYNALKKICGYLEISPEQMAFIGDFYNDMESFQLVGVSACVGNAPEEVKRHCNYILGDCMEGAVGDFLQKFQY